MDTPNIFLLRNVRQSKLNSIGRTNEHEIMLHGEMKSLVLNLKKAPAAGERSPPLNK